jgi:hypothetical protein
MRIDIETSDFPLTRARRSHAEQRLRSALTCCGERVRGVATRGVGRIVHCDTNVLVGDATTARDLPQCHWSK